MLLIFLFLIPMLCGEICMSELEGISYSFLKRPLCLYRLLR